ncbi:MAG: two-component system sensor histidine kinase CreC [Bdellovibrionales bacterium]|nr:two-component system sensor histidine kinase CreC [Bdellovibrionales bacterium]
MKIRTRIIIGLLLVVGVGFYYLIDWIISDLEPQYRKSTEDPLVDTSRVLAAVAGRTLGQNGEIDTALFRSIFDEVYSQKFSAQIYDFTKTEVDYRVYITDETGTVIFDSDDGRDVGKDYSEWRDVKRTLEGDYGARTSRDIPGEPNFSVMYVGAPIVHDNKTIGVLTVGKPTYNTNTFTENSKSRIAIGGTITACLVILVALFLSQMVTAPIQRLMEYTQQVRDGMRVQLPELGGSEVRDLGRAFEETRDALEGKQYVEGYVQALTHEIKSPVSAIKGAAELLREKMEPERRQRFIDNIENEAGRIQTIVEKLLLLSSLENMKVLQDGARIELSKIVRGVLDRFRPALEAKRLSLKESLLDSLEFFGDSFLVEQAISNVLSNSIDFTPEGGTINVETKHGDGVVQFEVVDSGTGFPEYALERVFDRFYSLRRPEGGKKSSGLGLSVVKEIAELHRGAVKVSNCSGRGARVIVEFAA